MVEKLTKAFEGLKNIQFTTNFEDTNLSKSDKMFFCVVAAEILSLKVMNIQNLPSVIENLINFCDDNDSDVRMLADESLNKIITSLSQSNMQRVLAELQKIIKTNGPARSLRAALIRFGHLSHYIRPTKGKAHVQMLIPNLIEITKREEESIHETLASSFESIFKILGVFLQDNTLKSLIKAFLHNLSSSNPVIRRCSASCIVTLVQCCKKPHIFNSYVLNSLLDCVVPINEDNSMDLILGVLGCLRLLLPTLTCVKNDEGITGSFGLRRRQEESVLSTDRLIQTYELCLYYTNSKDHNVVAAALEALNQVLQSPPQQLELFFLSPTGFSRSYIHSVRESKLSSRSGSEMSMAYCIPSVDESFLLEEYDISAEFESLSTKEPHGLNPSSSKSKDELGIYDGEGVIVESLFRDKISEKSLDSAGTSDIESDAESLGTSDFIAPDDFSFDFEKEKKSRDVFDFGKKKNQNELFVSNEKEIYCDMKKVIDVGSFTDPAVPLIYCARHLAVSFLLDGSSDLISDRAVRVSIKSLSLSCLSAIIKLYPVVMQMNLAKTQNDLYMQEISDVLLYCDHSDPQIRGCISTLGGQLIHSFLNESKGFSSHWLNNEKSKLNLSHLINIILKGLSDNSSVCTRQALSAVNFFINKALLSEYCNNFLPILEYLPSLKNNSYWLVKVKLLEVFSDLSYVCLHDLTKSNYFQEKVVDDVILPLLGNEDSRVRMAAAEALVKIVPSLYYGKSTVLHFIQPFTKHLNKWLKNKKECMNDLSPCPPFTHLMMDREEAGFDPKIEDSLSRIVAKLTSSLLIPENKYFLFGYLEALKLLSEKFPPTIYPVGWHISRHETQTSGEDNFLWTSNLTTTVLSLLVTSPALLDLAAFSNATFLLGNLFGGLCLFYLGKNHMTTDQFLNESVKLWNFFTNERISQLAEDIFSHLLKVLNIYSYLAEEVTLSKDSDSSLAANTFLPLLSPIKKQEKKSEEKISVKKLKIYNLKHTTQYIKLRRLLKNAHANFKISLDASVGNKFLDLLESTLHALSVMLEVATINETGRCAEEILSYLREIVSLRPIPSVNCVLQLLKSLFGTNLVSHWENKHVESLNFQGVNLFDSLFHFPTELLSEKIQSRLKLNSSENETFSMFNRRGARKIHFKNTDKNCLAMYIRLFEPMVVKSLQLYTISGNVKLQLTVLRLLNQLIQLRVNYCLFDQKRVFVDFILMQFDLIEHGQIPGIEELLPHIFKFLVLLSYQKQHSKPIISMPKIIQLCDGLMASDQSIQTHCIPALHPVVEEIFFSSDLLTPAEQKELDTQREVLFSMLLRLIEFPPVMDLLSVILRESKRFDEKDKFKRWSRQVIDALLPLLSQDRLRIETFEGQNSLTTLISSLCLSIFRPIDPFVKALFVEPDDYSCYNSTIRWISKVTTILENILFVKEDAFLNRLEEVSPQISLSTLVAHDNLSSPDPFNVKSFFQIFEPSETAARFILKVISIVADKVLKCFSLSLHLQRKLSMFFICVYYILKSGTYHRIKNALQKLLVKESESVIAICSLFQKMTHVHPLLASQFCYFLALLNYCDQNYWANILRKPCNLPAKLVQNCGVISLSDYLCDNPSDVDTLHYMLVHSLEEFVLLSCEIPIKGLLVTIQKRKSDWSLLINLVSAKDFKLADAHLIEKLLRIFEVSDSCHSWSLLGLLIKNFLNSPRLALSLLAGAIACRQVEYLLTLPKEEVVEQIDQKSFKSLIDFFQDERYLKRHLTLRGLLNKFSLKTFDMPLPELNQFGSIPVFELKTTELNEDWYFNQVKRRCSQSNASGVEIRGLLSKLSYEKIVKIMSSPDFNKRNLKSCLLRPSILREKSGRKEDEQDEQPNKSLNFSDPLFRASTTCLWSTISEIIENFKIPCSEAKCTGTDEVFQKEKFKKLIWETVPSLTLYLQMIYSENSEVENENVEKLRDFAQLCLEVVKVEIKFQNNFGKREIFSRNIENGLNCCSNILKSQKVRHAFSGKDALNRFVNNIFDIISNIVPYILQGKILAEREVLNSNELVQLEFLLAFVMSDADSELLQSCLINCFRTLILNVCRISDLNARILQVPESRDLQDIEVLENFISRFSTVGWSSKQRFEEIWMALLSVLGLNSQEDDLAEENGLIVQGNAVAVEGITTLLKNTMLDPKNGKLIHHGRDSLTMKNFLYKIPLVKNVYKDWDFIEKASRFTDNLEMISRRDRYSYGLLSIEYLWTAIKQISSRVDVYERHSTALDSVGLDLPSCIHLLTEIYNQWIYQANPDIRIITSLLKSSIVISDLFSDVSQYQWLLQFCFRIDEIVIEEDDTIRPLIVMGCCKAGSIVLPSNEMCEKIKKVMLKSNSLACRLATVRGLLYLLQSYVVSHTVNHTALPPVGSAFRTGEANFVANIVDTFLPIAIDMVQQFKTETAPVLEEYDRCHWALIFYLLQYYPSSLGNLKPELFNLILNKLFDKNCSQSVLVTLIRGAERLLLSTVIDDSFRDQLLKVSLEIIGHGSVSIVNHGLQLLMDLSFLDKRGKDIRQSVMGQDDPEKVMKDMEKINVLFEKLKKSYPKEAEIIGDVISYVLMDFSASDVLTKVIQEFLSPHQPHQKILAGLLFKVFERAETNLIEDWVVFSLPSFIQGLPIAMSIWTLNCFFVSASYEPWLRHLFPLVQSRMRMAELEDKKLLHLSSACFYKQLKQENQRKLFVQTFEKAATIDGVFLELLSSLQENCNF